MEATYLVTYFAHPQLLDICLDSIRKFSPTARIIVSREMHENSEAGDVILNKYGVTDRILHDMHSNSWVSAAQGLATACPTSIGVFIEHDAFLVKSLDDTLSKMDSYDLIGPEEVIPLSHLERNSPGFVCQNFFILNIDKMKEVGLDKMRLDPSRLPYPQKNRESGHGISQVMDRKLFMNVEPSGYGYGTFYDGVVHHLWYGSYRKRNVEVDGVDSGWLEGEVARLEKDYWSGKITIGCQDMQ